MTRINQLKTVLLLALLSGLIVLTGYLLVGDEIGLYYGLAFAGFSSFGSWYFLTAPRWPHSMPNRHLKKKNPSCTRELKS
ncbi:MAG: hypothetical protein AAF703_01130 [Cyanobacteria bacterium P01_D01_bin.105]